MTQTDDKVMFEIYRDAGPAGRHRVLYFTDLDTQQRESEIERALAGQHVFDGFIAAGDAAGRQRIERLLARLDAGAALTPAEIEAELSGSMV